MVDLKLDREDRDLLQRAAGFFRRHDVEAYVVGGTVRDWLLGRHSQDLDLAVAGDALALARALAREIGATYVPLDLERATARAVLRPTAYIDIARLQGGSLLADLANRDFTINAMALKLDDAAIGRLRVIDPLGGRDDLKARQIRAISEAAFRSDPLRLLRAMRLAAELHFDIGGKTAAWIAAHAASIKRPAAERVRDEIVRLFAGSGTAPYLRRLDDLGLMEPLFPEFERCKSIDQPAVHQWDVFEHLLTTVDRLDSLCLRLGLFPEDGSNGYTPALESAFQQSYTCLAPFAVSLRAHLRAALVGGRQRFVLLKLVALLHDIGKPQTRSVDEAGQIHFYRHEQVGADMVAAILRRLHFGAHEVKMGRSVTWHHMRPTWLASAEKVTRRAIYRYFRATGEAGVDVVLLALADALARSDTPAAHADWVAQIDISSRLLKAWFEQREALVAPPALVRGRDLIQAFELSPGPLVGELLEAIREAQVTEQVSSREEALAFAGEWLSARDGR